MFSQIFAWDKLISIYAELKENFIETGRFHSIKGIDGASLANFSEHLANNLRLVQQEVLEGKGLLPLLEVSIPKKSGKGNRIVYHSSVRDRIVYQALYKFLQPEVEKQLSPYLYSYRENRSHYHAIKNVRRFFLHQRHEYFFFKVDLKDYTDHLDHRILLEKFRSLECCDDETLALLTRIFRQEILLTTGLFSPSRGMVQGNTLCSLCANLYLADVDHEIVEKFPVFYQRVGDDIIVISKQLDLLREVEARLYERFAERKLLVSTKKTQLQSMEEPFEYLGFEFSKGQISLPPNREKSIKRWFANKFHRKTFRGRASLRKKIELTHQKLTSGEFPQTLNWLRYYHLMTNAEQLAEIDRFVKQRILIAFAGRDRLKDRFDPQLKSQARDCYQSFTRLYFKITQGRESLDSLNQRLKA